MAERERPANWEDWKWLHRWPRLTSIEWAFEWLVYWCKGLAIFDILEFVGRASGGRRPKRAEKHAKGPDFSRISSASL